MNYVIGRNDLKITYTSDNQLNPNIAPDAKRRLIVDVNGELVVDYYINMSLFSDGKLFM